jgi:molecular chaperone HscB
MDPFDLLGAPRRFDLDLGALEKTHRELSRALHPDKFAQAGASERRASLEKAASVNEAWRVLRDPIRRAEALFRLAGAEVGETKEPKPSPAFLMDVMEQREELAEARAARNLDKVKKLAVTIEARRAKVEAQLTQVFAANSAAADISKVALLGELRFYKRFLDEVSAIEDEAQELSL